MKKNEADIREERLNAELEVLAGAGDWDGVLQALDRYDANHERRHKEHRADMDVSVVDCGPNEGKYCGLANLLRLSNPNDWLDMIYSRDPENLYQLVEEYPVSTALRDLTPVQRQVVFLNIVHGIPAKEIAALMGCSVRNITKHRQKAMEHIRFLVTGAP